MDQVTPLRRIPLQCTMNTRDLGGYPASNGAVTQYGRVFRSDVPELPTPGDIAWLEKLNIRTVIDLRAPDEVLRKPSGFSGMSGVAYWNLPFSQGNQIAMSSSEMLSIYAELLADHENIRRVLTIIADAPGAVLYHCAAGKDRTGLMSALLLLLAGVSISDVLADYQVSYTYIRKWVRDKILRNEPGRDPKSVRSDMETLETTLDRLFGQYPTARSYLSACGIPPEILDRLCTKLICG